MSKLEVYTRFTYEDARFDEIHLDYINYDSKDWFNKYEGTNIEFNLKNVATVNEVIPKSLIKLTDFGEKIGLRYFDPFLIASVLKRKKYSLTIYSLDHVEEFMKLTNNYSAPWEDLVAYECSNNLAYYNFIKELWTRKTTLLVNKIKYREAVAYTKSFLELIEERIEIYDND